MNLLDLQETQIIELLDMYFGSIKSELDSREHVE